MPRKRHTYPWQPLTMTWSEVAEVAFRQSESWLRAHVPEDFPHPDHYDLFRFKEVQTWVRRRFGLIPPLEPIRPEPPPLPALLSAEAIHAAAAPWSDGCGIYFLIHEERIVYVGQSQNVYSRVSRHLSRHRNFDAWHWVPCRQDTLTRLERAYIEALMPVWNCDPATLRLREAMRDD
jgi:hypothetical protein